MDDSTQNSKFKSQIPDDSQVQDDTQQTPVAPDSSVDRPAGSRHKEAGPAVEYHMTPSEPREMQPVLDQEVQEAGVEHSVDETELHLTDEHAAVGIEPAKESVPVLQTQPTASPHVKNAPFTPQEAIEIMKTTPTDDTKHWLAVLFLMVTKKMHLVASQ